MLPSFQPSDHEAGEETTLGNVRPLVVLTLSNLLKLNNAWEKWAGLLKDYDGHWKYDFHRIELLKMEKEPVQVIWQSLLYDNRTLKYIKETLTQAGLYHAANFISVNVLGGATVPPRAAMNQVFPIPAQDNINVPPLIPPATSIQSRNQYQMNSMDSSTSSNLLTDISSNSTDLKEYSPVVYDQRDGAGLKWNVTVSGSTNKSNTSSSNEADGIREHEVRFSSEGGQKFINLHDAATPLVTVDSAQEKLHQLINQAVNSIDHLTLEPGKPHEISYVELQRITSGFDERSFILGGNLIGKGGFGEVFLGNLQSGTRIAVKKLRSNPSDELIKQFKDEVNAMSWLVHDNLLPLFGYSCDGPSLCIIYQYMARGSLEDALSIQGAVEKLNPSQRVSILKGTVNGVAHLHSLNPPLVHRDIKTANILLSENLTPKLGDFGLARLDPRIGAEQRTHITTKVIIGTSVYMPPEAFEGQIAPAWDCYSIGVVTLELITGLPSFDENREDKALPLHVDEVCDNESDILTLLEKDLTPAWNPETAQNMFKLAKNCLEKKKRRPNITQIAESLSSLNT